ncbi:MAG: DUF2799 domain-containing protein [Candidatus Dactylopiibacterium sp.]|nr:DUF2799 domain-containing protein [Candidatus Dactylopiibacterium sp.]
MSGVLIRPAVVCLFMLSACATLSEPECVHGDWEQIGYRDGQNGRPLARIDEHRDACLRYGVSPALPAYSAGRERGLNFYCTPANGVVVGRRGEHYAGVCPAASEERFLRGYEAGRAVHYARERMDHVERARRDAEMRMVEAPTREQAQYWNLRLLRLDMERDFIWMDLRRLETRAAEHGRY